MTDLISRHTRGGICLLEGSSDALAALAPRIAAAGFGSVWCPEFFDRSATATAAALASALAKDGVTLATGIAWAFARSPLLLANEARQIWASSKGRFILGLGAGSRHAQVNWLSLGETRGVGHMRSVIRALRACFASTGAVTFGSEHYRLDIKPTSPAWDPCPQLPILVAGIRPRMVELAATEADGLITHPFTSADYVRAVLRSSAVDPPNRQPAPRIVGLRLCSVAPTYRDSMKWAATHIAFECLGRNVDRVAEHHGWNEAISDVRKHGRSGDYASMVRAVPMDMIREVACVGLDETLAWCNRSDDAADVFDCIVAYPPSLAGPDAVRETTRALVGAR